MTSGRRITEQDVDAILRLASYRALDGDWLLNYEQIAAQLRIDSRTVARHIRLAAVNWGLLTRWHAEDSPYQA